MRVSSGRTVGEVVLEDNQNTGSTQIERLQIIDKKSITMSVGKNTVYTFRKSREKGQKCKKKEKQEETEKKTVQLFSERERDVFVRVVPHAGSQTPLTS